MHDCIKLNLITDLLEWSDHDLYKNKRSLFNFIVSATEKTRILNNYGLVEREIFIIMNGNNNYSPPVE